MSSTPTPSPQQAALLTALHTGGWWTHEELGNRCGCDMRQARSRLAPLVDRGLVRKRVDSRGLNVYRAVEGE